MNKFFTTALALLFLASCSNQNNSEKEKHQKEVQEYLDAYNQKYKELYTASSEASWAVQTHIVEGDTTNAYKSKLADEAMAKYTGSNENIDNAKKYLEWKNDLLPIQIKQLDKILFLAAGNPQSVEDVTKKLLLMTSTKF
jgi:peptidyl-dipeptidase A